MSRFERAQALIRWADQEAGTDTPGGRGPTVAMMAVAQAVVDVGELLEERFVGSVGHQPRLICGDSDVLPQEEGGHPIRCGLPPGHAGNHYDERWDAAWPTEDPEGLVRYLCTENGWTFLVPPESRQPSCPWCRTPCAPQAGRPVEEARCPYIDRGGQE